MIKDRNGNRNTAVIPLMKGRRMTEQPIKTHVLRVPPRIVPLLSPEEELEQERDLVPEHRWGPATILPRYQRSRQ